MDDYFGSDLEMRAIIRSVCADVFLGLFFRGTLAIVSYLLICCKALKTIFLNTLAALLFLYKTFQTSKDQKLSSVR